MAGTRALAVRREQVIAYRVAAQGLHRDATRVGDLAVLDIGVQEAMGQPAGYAFAARLPREVALGPGEVKVGPGHRLALAWTLRGAPHVHRRKDLDAIAGAIFPLSEADAAARLNETGPSVARAGIPALEQFGAAIDAMRDAVRRPTDKGTVSGVVSARLPKAMLRDCRPCATTHLSDSAMRASSIAAGIELEPGTSPPVLVPRHGAKRTTEPDPGALRALALAYLSLLGPAGPGEFAGYLEARRADVSERWPQDLVDVAVDGRPSSLPADRLDALSDAPPPELVRLLGSFDPYLQARDRSLIVPDKGVHKALWPVLGRPGAVLADGEIVGMWRTKASGAKLTITVEGFSTLRRATRAAVEDEAQRVAEVRGCSDVRVVHQG